jgi:putative membrane protein
LFKRQTQHHNLQQLKRWNVCALEPYSLSANNVEMKMRTFVLGSLLLVLPAAVMAQAVPTPTYVMKAGASDLFERQSGSLLSTSHNPKVRSFAMMMVRDHAKSTADVKAAARASRVAVKPPRLNAMQARNLAALRNARGEARDRLYVEQQKAAHQDALALQQTYAQSGRAAPLRRVAGRIIPEVQHHIEMLSTM